MGQNAGRVSQSPSCSNQTVSNAIETPNGSRKPTAEQRLFSPSRAVLDERNPANAPVPTFAVRQNETPSKAEPQSDVERHIQSDILKPAAKRTQGLMPERIALMGSHIAVGAEYDASMNAFFDSKEHIIFDIRKAADDTSEPEISVMAFPRSLCERLTIFGLCSSQKANFLVGLLENKLVAGIANEEIAGSDEEKAVIHFRCNSHIFSQQIEAAINYQQNNAETTHVVVGVEYGTEVAFVLTEKTNGQNSLIKYLAEVVDRIKRMKQVAAASMGIESRFKKINCKTYSNFNEYEAKNLYEVVMILHTAIVLPLRRKFAPPSQETLDEIEQFAEMTKSTNRSLMQLKINYPGLSKITGIENFETAFGSMFEQVRIMLRQKLIYVRRGAVDDKSIAEFLRENYANDNRQATLLRHAWDAMNFIKNKIQKPLQDAGISDKATEPKIILEISIAPIDMSLAEAYFSNGDGKCLSNIFPWLQSLDNQKLEELNSFVEFYKANEGKEQQFCYRFKRNTDSSPLFTCIYEDKGSEFIVPHRINGALINISSNLITATSIALRIEICWTRNWSDRTAAAMETLQCEAQVSAVHEGTGRAMKMKKVTLPNDITFDGLMESTAYSFTQKMIYPGGFTLGERHWSETYRTAGNETDLEGAASEYVSITYTAKQLNTLCNKGQQYTGGMPASSPSRNRTASNVATVPSDAKEAAYASIRPPTSVVDERQPTLKETPVSTLIKRQNATPRETQTQLWPPHQVLATNVTQADDKWVLAVSEAREIPNPAIARHTLQPQSKKAEPQPVIVEQYVLSDTPKPETETQEFLPERIVLLGSHIVIGAEYDACMNAFFDTKEQLTFDVEKTVDDSSEQEISVMAFPQSVCERLNIFGLCSSLKVNFLVGLLENKLVAGIANEEITGSDEEKAVIHFRCKSHTFYRQIIAAHYQQNNAESTHVVVGVEYGTEVVFVLTEKKIVGQKSLMEYLTEVVDRIKNMKKGTAVTIETESRFKQINCQAYSNIENYQAKNFYQAVMILHSLMTENIEHNSPQTAIVLPLRRRYAPPAKETLDEIERFAEMTISTKRSLLQLKRTYTDLSKVIGIDHLEAALKRMYEQVLISLRQLLVNVRRGVTDEKSIIQFLRQNHTQNNKQANMLKHANETINFVLNKIQRPLQDADISDIGIEPKIVLEIAIAPTDQHRTDAYFSSGDGKSLNNLFPWLQSLDNQKLEELNSFVEFYKANEGKEQQFCYRFKRNTDSSPLFTCIYEDKGSEFIVPHRINGALINISSNLITATSIALRIEICWTRNWSDRTAAAMETLQCEAQVCAIREGNGTAVEMKKVTLPNDIVFDGLRESTAYSFTHEVVLPDGFNLGKREWSEKFRTGESRVQTIINRSQPVDNEPGFYELPKTVVASGEGFRKCQVGAHKINQIDEKVVLVVGGTGSGKSTFINAMANYLYEVNFFHPFRLQLITKQDDINESQSLCTAKSQTKVVSAYELNETRLPYRVTIVDTPGFGDTDGMDRDQLTIQYIKEWFEWQNAAGQQTIDAVCTVIRSNENRVTARALYELRLVLSLFSENLKKNMITAFTFNDSDVPTAIMALNKDGLLLGENMLPFNNRSFMELFSNDLLLDIFWKRTSKSFERFFDIVEKFEPRSILHTLDVLRRRKALEEQAVKFSEQVTTQKKKVQQIEYVIEQLNSEIIDLRRAQDFKIKQKRFILVEVPAKNGIFTTFCKQCSITCHEDCKEVKGDDEQLFNCNMMTVKDPKYALCTVCPRKCPWTVHVHSSVILKQVECEEEITVAQVFEQYHIKMRDRNSAEILLELLAKDLLKEGKILGDTIKAIRQHLNVLNEIALRPGLTTDSKYLVHLIETEKQAMEPGSIKRIVLLQQHLKIVRLLEEEQQPGGCFSNETESVSIAYLGHKFPTIYKQLDDKGYFKANSVRFDNTAISPEKMLEYIERTFPVELQTVKRNPSGYLPVNPSPAVVIESFKRTFPSLAAIALQQLQEEADSASPSGSEAPSEHSVEAELAEQNKLIDQVKLTDDAENDHISKSRVLNNHISVWKRLEKKYFS